jgi:hypothetical protein
MAFAEYGTSGEFDMAQRVENKLANR